MNLIKGLEGKKKDRHTVHTTIQMTTIRQESHLIR